MAEEYDRDIVRNIIRKLVLQVGGVESVAVQRTWDGFHVVISPRAGQSDELLSKQVHSILVESFPALEKYIRVFVATEQMRPSDALTERPRIELEQVNFSSHPNNKFSINVRLRRSGGTSVEVTKEGQYLIENVIRLAAEATLEAALPFFPHRTDGTVLGTKQIEIGYENLVVVLISLNLRTGQASTSGSASLKKGSHIGAIAATLKAINRYLEFYDGE
jgi:hypothetical protein